MVCTVNDSTSSSAIVSTADGSGIIKLQSNGVTTNALAWVRFNGASGAIASSYNVSSVTRNALGTYVVNFATALADTNYTAFGSPSPNTGYSYNPGPVIFFTNGGSIVAPSTTSISLIQYSANYSTYIDPLYESVVIFGN